MDTDASLLDDARALLADASRKPAQLRAIDPSLIDISLRENPVGSGIGHTPADKLRILPQLRAFGMKNIHLGSLDCALPDEPEVGDDFMAWLRDHGVDMRGCCRVERLLPLATSLQELDAGQPVPDDVPVLGRNAYRLTLDFFRQQAARPMDLPPERIGGHYGYRICPVVSDRPVIAGRLAEVTGQSAASFPGEVLDWMIRLMRRDLRACLRLAYDQPAGLLDLHRRALAMPPAPTATAFPETR